MAKNMWETGNINLCSLSGSANFAFCHSNIWHKHTSPTFLPSKVLNANNIPNAFRAKALNTKVLWFNRWYAAKYVENMYVKCSWQQYIGLYGQCFQFMCPSAIANSVESGWQRRRICQERIQVGYPCGCIPVISRILQEKGSINKERHHASSNC